MMMVIQQRSIWLMLLMMTMMEVESRDPQWKQKGPLQHYFVLE